MSKKLIIVTSAILIIMAFFGGQLTGYLNQRVASENLDPYEVAEHYGQYISEWIDDTNGRWIW